MVKHNPNNERIKHQYFDFLREAMRMSEHTIDGVAKSLARFEEYTKYKDFRTYRVEQAIGFKQHLSEQKNLSGSLLSKSTIHTTHANLKRFFEWLSREPGYKSSIKFSDAEYFNTSSKDRKIATARRIQKVPTLEQITYVIKSMLSNTDIEKRNRALIAFTLITGARDSAIASAKLKHIDLEKGSFFQDARDVETKFSKTFMTYFFPVGDELLEIFKDWVIYLKVDKLYGNDDPLFPMTHISIGKSNQFEAIGIKPHHWSSAAPIREIFKDAFEKAGFHYFNPHSFRNTLVKLGETRCKTPEAFKAWSQNLGHESVLTTFYSYGEVSQDRQAEIIKTTTPTNQNLQADKLHLANAIVKLIDSIER